MQNNTNPSINPHTSFSKFLKATKITLSALVLSAVLFQPILSGYAQEFDQQLDQFYLEPSSSVSELAYLLEEQAEFVGFGQTEIVSQNTQKNPYFGDELVMNLLFDNDSETEEYSQDNNTNLQKIIEESKGTKVACFPLCGVPPIGRQVPFSPEIYGRTTLPRYFKYNYFITDWEYENYIRPNYNEEDWFGKKAAIRNFCRNKYGNSLTGIGYGGRARCVYLSQEII